MYVNKNGILIKDYPLRLITIVIIKKTSDKEFENNKYSENKNDVHVADDYICYKIARIMKKM